MFKIIWILFSCITLSSTTLAHTNATLNELAIQFIEAKNARQQPSSSANDVDHYLSLLADNFIDEHVKHNFTYSDKKTLRADMLNKLKDKIIHSKIKINHLTVGKNVVFIKLTAPIADVHEHPNKKQIKY